MTGNGSLWGLMTVISKSSAKWGVHTYAEYAKSGLVTILHIAKDLKYFFLHILHIVLQILLHILHTVLHILHIALHILHMKMGMFIFCMIQFTYPADFCHILHI
jgi:hypothetical protein